MSRPLNGDPLSRTIERICGWAPRLRIRHRIGFAVAKNASQVARGFRWDEELWRNVQPEDGLAPQVGVAVKDAFRCKHCRQYASIFPDEVDVHWDYHGHGVTEGDNAEKVLVQTWYGSFVNGYNNSYCVVDESIKWNGEDSSEGLGEDECERLLAEETQVVLRKYYVKNEKYHQLICIDEGCQRAVDAQFAAMHLRNRHEVSA